MTTDQSVSEILLRWQDQFQKGQPPTPEELCRECPEHLAEVRRRVAALRAVFGLLSSDSPRGSPSESPSTWVQPPPEANAGPAIPGYTILEELDRGGMGVVYKARQVKLNRLVALKMIRAGKGGDEEHLARFQVEAQAIARLRHPHIVQIYEIGEHGGLPFLSLEFVEGGSLARNLQGRPWPPGRAAELVADLAQAMQHAHSQGVLHRDLKPANILLTADGSPKVTDFGLAKQMHASLIQTRHGTIMGTPAYMAPEQAQGKTKETGPATDVYALGAILYELLTGRPPFQGASALEILEQVRSSVPAPPGQVQPGLPGDLEAVCLKCLEKEPGRRYPTAAELEQELRRFLARAAGPAPTPPDPVQGPPEKEVAAGEKRDPTCGPGMLPPAARHPEGGEEQGASPPPNPAGEVPPVSELLVRWEEWRRQGRDVSVEEWGPDEPGPREEVRRRLVALRAAYQLLEAGALDQPAVTPAPPPDLYAIRVTVSPPPPVPELGKGDYLAGKLDGTPFPTRQAARLVEALARAVHAAHERGMVHGNLQPAKILLTADGTPQITDRGPAECPPSLAGPARSGVVLDNPCYLAPEQVSGQAGEAGPGADVYALGAILYELLTGRPPFKAETPLETGLQVVRKEPVPPSRLNPKVSHRLEAVCLKCLRKAPGQRYPTAAALAGDLSRFLQGQPVLAHPPGKLGRAAQWLRRRPGAATGIAITLLGILGLSVWGLFFILRLEGERAQALRQGAVARAQRDTARRLADAHQRAAHTQEVLARLEEFFSLLEDAETSQWGFLLTGEEPYLEPYRVALARHEELLEDLARLTGANPRQHDRLKALAREAGTHFQEIRQTIDRVKKTGAPIAAKEIKGHAGKSRLDRIRALIREMKGEELGLQ